MGTRSKQEDEAIANEFAELFDKKHKPGGGLTEEEQQRLTQLAQQIAPGDRVCFHETALEALDSLHRE